MALNRTDDYDCGNADNDDSNPKDKPSPISHARFYPLRPVATHHSLTLVLTILPAAFHLALPEKDEAIEGELPSARRGDGK